LESGHNPQVALVALENTSPRLLMLIRTSVNAQPLVENIIVFSRSDDGKSARLFETGES
jgi:hypothetical protein